MKLVSGYSNRVLEVRVDRKCDYETYLEDGVNQIIDYCFERLIHLLLT